MTQAGGNVENVNTWKCTGNALEVHSEQFFPQEQIEN